MHWFSSRYFQPPGLWFGRFYFYCFMNNHHVRYEQVREWVAGTWSTAGKRLLCIQDTSEANFSSHSGALSIQDPTKSTEAGFFRHPSLRLELADGFPLGLSDLLLFNRRWRQADKRQRHYQQLALEQKESYRWLKYAQNSRQKLALAAYVIELFAMVKSHEGRRERQGAEGDGYPGAARGFANHPAQRRPGAGGQTGQSGF